MIWQGLKVLLVVVLTIVGVYFAVGWYHTYQFGKGKNSDIWLDADFLDLEALAIDGLPAIDRVLYNPMGLKDADYAPFLHSSQGSALLPLDIFQALEVAGGEDLFASSANLLGYRYFPSVKRADNADGLAIGFARTEKPWQGEIFVGLTCMGCHAGLLTYQGTGLFIAGAPTQGDFQTMTEELSAAVTAALNDGAKFDRLAKRLGVGEAAERAELRRRLSREEAILTQRITINAAPIRYGYGRVDAVGQIYNMATSVNPGLPQNASPPDAPVSYPHLWGTGQADVAQWTGFAPNAILGSILLRNIGEVIGVFGRVDMKEGALTIPSSVNIRELGQLEEWVNHMEPPAWPEDVLGKIDRDLAAKGAALYDDHCKGCHVIAAPYEPYKATLVSPDELGVDPLAARNTLETGVTTKGTTMPKLKMLIEQTFFVAAAQLEDTLEALFAGDILDKFGKRGGFTYKARTLNGIWATAPFLHNGSVPTLYDLLSPPEERPKSFTLGAWEFDPVKVGLAPYDGPDGFVLDTTLPGNRNTGHDARIFETTFSKEQREALVEFLKTL
ncbi:hypothetical protein LCL97_09625 [Seohaeicola saemankumensis]|nr:di-heme-cytochrome C peroxidase [Seohaeicola saemankumensis]MCA0871086.1 hypothetical protein [Seohaeicola saemankumensis]